MADSVLLSARPNNIDACVQLAQERNLGIEIMTFAFPHILDGDWKRLLAQYQTLLQNVPGMITLHGPFIDLISGSPDQRVNQLCMDRYKQALFIAAELDCEQVIYHANFIATLRNDFYRAGWHKRNVEFWTKFLEYADRYNMTVALENMWEFDPNIIGDLIRAVNHPHFRVCLDVGHAHLFSDPQFDFEDWLDILGDWIIELHINNNNGTIDEHHSLDWENGILDYDNLLPKIQTAIQSPCFVLEMDHIEDMRESLSRFALA